MKNSERNLHQKFVKYGANAKLWMRKCVLLLPEIERHQIWKKKRFGSIYEYAAKLAGMSHRQAEDALRIMKKIEDKPDLIEVVREKGVNSVRPIVTIATRENAKFLAEKAKNMSVNTLRVFRRDYLDKSRNVPESKPEKMQITMNLEPEIVQKLEKLKGKDEWNELMKQFLEMREKQLEEKPPVKKTQSKHIPNLIQNYIKYRSNKKCEFGQCKKDAEILHHTDRFALKREHNPDKIVALCTEHERIVHLGLISNEHDPPDKWKIREKPDKYDIKFLIDQKVLEHRKII
ncbi:MAG: hypothetical protein V1679_00090 [Candidatus Peregrinibacteria bacterium]